MQTYTTNTLTSLDDDTKEIIVSFLCAIDVVALQGCSRDWIPCCRARSVWSRLVAVDFEATRSASLKRGNSFRERALHSLFPSLRRPDPSSSSVLGEAITEHPLTIYQRYAKAHWSKRKKAKAQAKEREATSQAYNKKARLRCVLDVFEYPLGVGAYGVALFVMALLLLLKLDGIASDIPWLAVFAAPVLQAVVFLCGVTLSLCTRLCNRVASSTSHLCNGQYNSNDTACFHAMVDLARYSADHHRRCCPALCSRVCSCIWATCLPLLLMGATPAVVALKLDGFLPANISWALTLAPLWIAFGLWCILPLLSRGDSVKLFLVSLILYVPLLIVCALAVARADGVISTTAAVMFTPLWLLDLGLLCSMVFFACMAWHEDDDNDDRRDMLIACEYTVLSETPTDGQRKPSPTQSAVIPMVVLFCVFLMPQVWASVVDAQTGAFPINGFLGPITALVGVGAVMNCACAIFICCKSRKRSSTFSGLYSRDSCKKLWCCCCAGMRRARGAPVIVIMNVYGTAMDTTTAARPRLGAAARRIQAREHVDDGPMVDVIV